METEIMKTLRYQLMFPILSEYISYYSDNLPGSVKENAIILGKAITISSIPRAAQAHNIAAILIYIISKGNNYFPPCLDINKKDQYDKLSEIVVKDINRLKKELNPLLNDQDMKILNNIIDKWNKSFVSDVSSVSEIAITEQKEQKEPQSVVKESPKLSGKRLTKRVMVIFNAASTEDIDREDVSTFVNDYVMIQALKYINSFDFGANLGINPKRIKELRGEFVNYFSFKLNATKNKYIMTRKELQRITYEIGTLTVKTMITVHFNYVLPKIQLVFSHFMDKYLVRGDNYSDDKLSGKFFAP